MVIPTSSRGPNLRHAELACALESPSRSGLPVAAGGVLHLKGRSFRSPLALRWRFARPLGMLLSILAAIALGNIMALPAAASPALVQHASKDAGTTLSSSLAFPLNNTAGNWVGVIIRAGHSGQVFAVSDSRGNTYRQALRFNQTLDMPNGETAAIYYAENIVGGTNTVTVSESISNNTLRFAILEYSGLEASNSLGWIIAAEGTGSTLDS